MSEELHPPSPRIRHPHPVNRIAKVPVRGPDLASRSEGRAFMIEAGRVRVKTARQIDSARVEPWNACRCDHRGIAKPVGEPEPPRVWLYHKPTGLG